MAKKVLFGITWTWQKITGLILGLFGIGTLTSCYGVVPYYEPVDISGVIMGDIDGDGQMEPVPGISVETNVLTTTTTAEGVFHLNYDANEEHYLKISDIDGKENGSFKSKDCIIEDYLPETSEDEVSFKLKPIYLETKSESDN